jgi:ABC-type proline/glycine betaine transport system ATPase subunit
VKINEEQCLRVQKGDNQTMECYNSALVKLYSDVHSMSVNWLWYPYIPYGKITILQGDPGDGKSTMIMNIIAAVSTGGFTPDGKKIKKPQTVIYQCSEDGVADTIKPTAPCGRSGL